MLRLLYPKLYVPSLFHIDLNKLEKMGIRGMLFDLDNTIVPRDCHQFSPAVSRWLKELQRRGFKLCIVSNNGSTRVNALAGQLGVPTVVRAVKPRKRPFLRALEILGISPHETAVVGDQVFTDILGGNRLGLYTILVMPLPGKEFWATELINRRLEKLVLCRFKRKLALQTGDNWDV